MKANLLMGAILLLLLGLAACSPPKEQAGADRKRFEEIKAKAEKGDAEAQYNLGQCYASGEGVAKDETEMAKWFRKAADQGFAEAQYNLGHCYASGEGVAKDATEAVEWLRKAAEQGFVDAQYDIGVCYQSGLGVTNDYVQAHKWVSLASAGGHKGAKERLPNVEAKMTKEQITEAQRLAREFKPRKTPEPGASSLGQPPKP
jgi:hypothetical protein